MAATKGKHLRNQPCACGSGRKYKQCCMAKDAAKQTSQVQWVMYLLVAFVLAGAVGIFLNIVNGNHQGSPASGGVWSEEHGHYH